MWKEKILGNKLLVIRALAVLGLGVLAIGGIIFRQQIGDFFKNRIAQGTRLPDVKVPTIVDGELVLPEVSKGEELGLFGNKSGASRLALVSANLTAVTDEKGQKIVGFRVTGEVRNIGTQIVTDFSPRVRFFDSNGQVVGQKIGRKTPGYRFFGLRPDAQTYYDVIVEDPPESERLEVVFNVASSSASLEFEELKIASRSVEVKKAQRQAPRRAPETTGTESAAATQAAQVTMEGNEVEYYTVTGAIINTFTEPLTEMTVYTWVKDTENKVISFAKQDFLNDLLSVGEKLDFRMTLVPMRPGVEMVSYEIAAWGKQYKY